MPPKVNSSLADALMPLKRPYASARARGPRAPKRGCYSLSRRERTPRDAAWQIAGYDEPTRVERTNMRGRILVALLTVALLADAPDVFAASMNAQHRYALPFFVQA